MFSNQINLELIQTRIHAGGPAGLPPPPGPVKKGEKGKGKERKEKGKRRNDTKKLSRHNRFFRAYIGLHWPMGVGAGSPVPINKGEIWKNNEFMHQKF